MSCLMFIPCEIKKIYKNVFTIDLPRELTYADVIEELSMHPNMMKVRMVALAE